MSVVFYEMAHSPFCIPIAQLLIAAGVEFERREVPNWDRSEVIRLTGGAYYQVPLLVHDGQCIHERGAESQDVARHIDKTWIGGRLFPERLTAPHDCVLDFLENEVEARTFKLVDPAYLDDMADLAARVMIIRHKERTFGRGCVEAWRRSAGAIRAEADTLLQRFEVTLRHSPFLLGHEPLYADFLLFGILGNLTFRGYNQLSKDQTALADWRERLAAHRFR